MKIINEMNLVPYIDIMLVLLIIFMISLPNIHGGMDIHVPSYRYTKQIESNIKDNILIVSIDSNGKYYIESESNGKKDSVETLDNMKDVLRRNLYLNSNTNIYTKCTVQANANIQYQKVIDLVSAIKDIGVDNIGLATKEL